MHDLKQQPNDEKKIHDDHLIFKTTHVDKNPKSSIVQRKNGLHCETINLLGDYHSINNYRNYRQEQELKRSIYRQYTIHKMYIPQGW
jgi:hypothetical protein